jgi:hypothetical protein
MSFNIKPVYVINIKGVITEEEIKLLRKDINKELGDQYRVVFDIEVHKITKQKYLR